jgi:hypothetical protein
LEGVNKLSIVCSKLALQRSIPSLQTSKYAQQKLPGIKGHPDHTPHPDLIYSACAAGKIIFLFVYKTILLQRRMSIFFTLFFTQ